LAACIAQLNHRWFTLFLLSAHAGSLLLLIGGIVRLVSLRLTGVPDFSSLLLLVGGIVKCVSLRLSGVPDPRPSHPFGDILAPPNVHALDIIFWCAILCLMDRFTPGAV
jgi:hypothetical protein